MTKNVHLFQYTYIYLKLILYKLYKNGITKTKDIAEKLNIHYATVIQYLKRGNKYNWCDYNLPSVSKISL